MSNENVFIILNEKKSLDEQETLYLKDIGEIYSKNTSLKSEIENLEVYKSSPEEDWDYITSNDLIEKIQAKFPNIDINIFGSTETMLEIKSQERENKFFEFIKIAFVSIVLFFGAALGIMYFHEDVNMIDALDKLYYTFSGEQKKNALIMNVPYSIGLGIGMITFFKRINSKSRRRRKEPGPLDVELYLYDQDEEDYILHELKKHRFKD